MKTANIWETPVCEENIFFPQNVFLYDLLIFKVFVFHFLSSSSTFIFVVFKNVVGKMLEVVLNYCLISNIIRNYDNKWDHKTSNIYVYGIIYCFFCCSSSISFSQTRQWHAYERRKLVIYGCNCHLSF